MPRKSTKFTAQRPLKVYSIDELNSLYEQNKGSYQALKILEKELMNRKPSVTELLRMKVTSDLYGVPVVKYGAAPNIKKEAAAPKDTSTPSPSNRVAIFECTCKAKVRVPFKKQTWVIACPKCGTQYDCTWQDLACVLNKKTSSQPESSAKLTKIQALAVLGLKGTESLEDLKILKKRLLQAYHPDKYAGAPDKIQKYAEEEFKKIMAAFNTLE